MQKQVKQSPVEYLRKYQSFPRQRTRSLSPSLSRRTVRTTSLPVPVEKSPEPEPVALAQSGADQFRFQNLRSFYRKECEEDLSPSLSCRTVRTTSLPVAVEKRPEPEPEPVALALSGADQFRFQNLRSFYRKECEEDLSPSLSCRTVRTTSLPVAVEKMPEPEPVALALSGADQFRFQNLRSFYRKECEEDLSKIGRDASFQSRFPGTPPRVVIREEPIESSTAEQDDSITILTYSKSPSADFRQSMQEMVEARVASNGVVDRQFMEELLFRYLEMNSEKFYGCIVRAFLDLIVITREDSGRFPARRRSCIGGRRRLKLEIKRMRKFCQNQFVPK